MVSKDFMYNDKNLSDFGFIMVNSNELDSFGLSREIIKGTNTSNKSVITHFGTKYTDVITIYFFIVKNICSVNNNCEISYHELRAIQSWLTSPKVPKTLLIKPVKYNTIEYYGVFTDVTPYVYNGLNGLYLTFTCNSPYAFEKRNFEIACTNSITKEIICDTDELEEMVYPIITLKPNASGTFSIKNVTENRTMSFNLSNTYTNVIIDCKLKRIIADNKVLNLFDIGWNTDEITDSNNVNTGIFKLYWLRFLAGKNTLQFNGNGTFNIQYKVPIKIGGYANV